MSVPAFCAVSHEAHELVDLALGTVATACRLRALASSNSTYQNGNTNIVHIATLT